MTDTLISIGWIIVSVICLEYWCEGRETNQFEKQFFAGCLGVFLVAFGLARWL